MKLRKEVLFSIVYFCSYVAQAIGYCQLVPFLTQIGYSATQRSYMFAFGAIVGMFAEFYIGYLCDKNKTIKKYIYIVYPLYSVIVILLYLLNFKSLLVHILIVGANQLFFHASMGLIDSWVLESGQQCKESFGSIRAFGSLGWVFGSYIVSHLVNLLGYKYIGFIYAAIVVVICFVCYFIDDAIKTVNDKINYKDLKLLFINKKYVVLILIFFGIFMMQNSLDYAIVDKLNSLFATPIEIGYYWMITGIVEIPLMFFGNKLAKKYGYTNMLVIAIVVYGLRFVLYGLSGNVAQVMIISLLQFFTFPIVQVVVKHLIDKETPESLKSSGQLIGLSLYSSTSALCAPLITGYIEDGFGINNALFVISTYAIFSLIFLAIYKIMDKREAK